MKFMPLGIIMFAEQNSLWGVCVCVKNNKVALTPPNTSFHCSTSPLQCPDCKLRDETSEQN